MKYFCVCREMLACHGRSYWNCKMSVLERRHFSVGRRQETNKYLEGQGIHICKRVHV